LLTLVLTGCCQLSGRDAKEIAEELVDNFKKTIVGNLTCYGQPTELLRNACYARASQLTAELVDHAGSYRLAYMNCDGPGLEKAVSAMAKIVESTVGGWKNPFRPAHLIDLQGQGTGRNNLTSTTVTLNQGTTLRIQIRPQSPVFGPITLAGSFTADLTTVGGIVFGPLTALSISGTLANQPTWQLALMPSAGNQCSLGSASGGIRTGSFEALVRFTYGAVSWPLSIRVPLKVSQDLSSWDLTSGSDLVPADGYFPKIVNANDRLGSGCAGSNGVDPFINAASIPRVGDPLAMTLHQAKPNSLAVLCIGESRTDYGGIPLPFDLAGVGAPGCALQVSIALLLVTTTSATGSGQLTVPVPNDPALVIQYVYHQWLVLDPANLLGLVVSGGLRTQFLAR
jgi:hypothetical protein